ncbi:MAG TPA: TQO small subunit DoxD [Candidatus Acidoferrales bacterium]|nr:TQO small subunit DoxD [Candidatus Acidoferrales bacterium]
MLPAAQKYATWLGVMRIVTGAFWLAHGIPKLLNPGFFGANGMMSGMVTQMSSNGSGFYQTFLQTVVLPHAGLFSYLVAWGETLTGVSLLLGLLTSAGGVVGVFLALNYFLMKGSLAHITSLGGLDFAAMELSFINIVLPTGLVFGLDGIWRRAPRNVPAGET